MHYSLSSERVQLRLLPLVTSLLGLGLFAGRDTYCPRYASALRSGALESRISPSNGWSSSRIRKIAPDTESAQTNRVASTVALGGAKRPKLTNRTVSQNTSTTRNGIAIELPLCSISNQRVCAISVLIWIAWLWSARCASCCGESCTILS